MTSSSSFITNVAIQELKEPVATVSAVITGWMKVIAHSRYARVRLIRLKAIVMQGRDGKDVPAMMDGLQSRLGTLDLVLMGIQITNTPAAPAGQ